MAILFVHIPKTAGTSFRKGADQYFGSNRIINDYGLNSVETSLNVRQNMYDEPDAFLFKNHIEKSETKFMTGHYWLNKYSHIFSIENTVSFLRNPVDRVVSEYNHHVNNYGYDGTLEMFYKTPAQQNKQSKLLTGAPVESIGFLGLTEEYKTSLQLFNKRFNTDIVDQTLNVGNYNKKLISPAVRNEISVLNNQDQILYTKVSNLLKIRNELTCKEQPYTRGLLTEYKNSRFFGWACFDTTDEAVKLEYLNNDIVIGSLKAVEWRPQLSALGIKRNGYVGFSFSIDSLKPLDIISVRVKQTGQILNGSITIPIE